MSRALVTWKPYKSSPIAPRHVQAFTHKFRLWSAFRVADPDHQASVLNRVTGD
ncbi:MAG: hypothetical protein JNM18_14975 [Planctomycetaceae bacterium]|nr:hypothetical protein [Planctomycetaceae bacterium]